MMIRAATTLPTMMEGDSASDGNNIVDDSPLDEVRVEIPSPVGSQLLVATRCCDLQYTAVLH